MFDCSVVEYIVAAGTARKYFTKHSKDLNGNSMVSIQHAHDSRERQKEGVGFLLIPCLITRPWLTPGQRPCRSHYNLSPRPTSKTPDYREEKNEVSKDKTERQRDERKEGLKRGRWMETEWKHVFFVSGM